MPPPDLFNPGLPARLELGGLTVEGFSVSALATYVSVPAFKVVFDLGHCPEDLVATPAVFLSHTHMDHMAGVPMWASLRQMRQQRDAVVFCPAESAPALMSMLAAHDALEGAAPGEGLAEYVKVVGVSPGMGIELKGGSRLKVQTFAAHHRVPSVGYTVVEERNKLRPEYADFEPATLERLRKEGVQITARVTAPLFTYIGDCTAETLRANPEVGRSKVLCIEVTHLEPGEEELSVRYGHTHLNHLVELAAEGAPALGAEHIILKHFSMRYREAETIRKIVDSTLPPALRARVHLLLAT